MSLDIDFKDLSFIRSVDTDLAESILNVCKLSVKEMFDTMNSPGNVDDIYFKSLTKNQVEVMHTFYESMLEIFLEYEMYEDCSKLAEIIDKLGMFRND